VVRKTELNLSEVDVSIAAAVKEITELLKAFKDFRYSIAVRADGKREIHIMEA